MCILHLSVISFWKVLEFFCVIHLFPGKVLEFFRNKIVGTLSTAIKFSLIHLCLTSCKRDIKKQCRPRSDGTEHGPDQGLHCLH